MSSRWELHDRAWREPAQVVSHWVGAARLDRAGLRFTTRGDWWEVLDELEITLLVTREYEHLVVAFSVGPRGPRATFLPLPHPSGIAVDRARGAAHIAATRNPNQVVELAAVHGTLDVAGADPAAVSGRPLMPVRTTFLPGAFYLHDLAFVSGVLHGNAVGRNAVVAIERGMPSSPRWWPKCIEEDGVPRFDQNFIQLNSIAAGSDLASSYFSASTDRLSARRPGHRNFPVDGRGVIFDGRTREPAVRGLTRPHSARLHDGALWVANSGYGEIGIARGEVMEPICRLDGWTRGLCFAGEHVFAGTSRVIPRFRQYAPGLVGDRSRCAVHVIDATTGRVRGSLHWPSGNQIFAIDWLPRSVTAGLPFDVRRSAASKERKLFYGFDPIPTGAGGLPWER